MSDKMIHFIFNEEKPDGDPFSNRVLNKAFPIWLVKDLPGFTACLEALPLDHTITVWVHLQAVSNVGLNAIPNLPYGPTQTFKGEDIAAVLKRRFGDSFFFEYITRADVSTLPRTHRDQIGIIHINELEDKVKEVRYHHKVSELLGPGMKEYDTVFISHSHLDKSICDKLTKLLVNGFAIPADKIFYTSGTSTGIRTGKAIPNALQDRFLEIGLFISLVTQEYLKSDVCRGEINAMKLLSKSLNNAPIVFKTEDVSYKETGFLNEHDITLNLSEKQHFFKIFDDFRSFFNRYPCKLEKLNEEIDLFINNFT